LPGIRGLVVGRALLYPPDDDVETAVDHAASLVRPGSPNGSIAADVLRDPAHRDHVTK
jgi:hypothetical protein